jgi:hypothetical protein
MRIFSSVSLATCVSLFMFANAAEARRVTTPPPPTQFPLTGSAQFGASVGETVIAPDGNSSYVEQAGTSGVGGVTISYDKISGTYSVRDMADGFAATKVRRSSTSGIYDLYSKQVRGIVDEIKIYNAAHANSSAVPLTYVNFGMWTHHDSGTATTRQYALVYGFLTPESAIPRSGSASYRTMVNGSSTIIGTNAGTRDVGGSATFDVDFASAAVNTQLSLAYVVNGEQTPIGTFSGSSGIYSNQFWGPLTSNVSYFVGGSFAGAFYGPNAEEMGYSFAIKRYNPDPYAGASIYTLDEGIVGTVVGARH